MPSDVFAKLAASLPAGDDIESQARSALFLLVERIDAVGHSAQPVIDDPLACPNCGERVSSLRTPYCSDGCRAVAAFVRQFRTALAEGTALDPERQVSFGQALWFVLGGGRPLRQHIAPSSALKQVFKRENGLCEACGSPATTIDHTGSG